MPSHGLGLGRPRGVCLLTATSLRHSNPPPLMNKPALKAGLFINTEAGGFEPPIGLPLCLISNQVLSTTQPRFPAVLTLVQFLSRGGEANCLASPRNFSENYFRSGPELEARGKIPTNHLSRSGSGFDSPEGLI